MLKYIIILGVFVVYIAKADLTHYTWIGLTVYGFWRLLKHYDYHRSLSTAVFWVHVNIASGVLLMSILECQLLIDAHAKYGDVLYILLNFGVHYFPLLDVYHSIITDSNDQTTWVSGILVATGLYTAYINLHHPYQVYGCSILFDQLAVMTPPLLSLGVVFIIITAFLLLDKPTNSRTTTQKTEFVYPAPLTTPKASTASLRLK